MSASQFSRPDDPVLRFTPYAWAKLIWFRDRGDTEIGGFGVTPQGDPLLIEDFVTVRQETSCVTVKFDDEAVADLFESQVEAGRTPGQFARIWLHTHPGNSAEPSGVDEETFARVFGGCDWTVMFILAKGGKTYARLRFNAGPGGEVLLPVAVDYHTPFSASDHEAWEAEYQLHVHPEPVNALVGGGWPADDFGAPEWMDPFDMDVDEELELLARARDSEPDELDELFGNESEVIV